MLIKNGHLFWCPVLVEPCHCKTSGYVVTTMLALSVASFEFWGGIESLSLMLLADAWHVSSDMAVYAVAIWGNVMAVRRLAGVEDIKNRWAMINANMLIAVAFVTIALAVKRMFSPQEVVSAHMLFVASIGLAANGVMYFVLKAFRIKHEHHDEEYDHLHDTAIWHTASDSVLSLIVVSVGWSRWKFPALEEYGWVESAGALVIFDGLIFVAAKMKREIRQKNEFCNHHH